MSSFVDMLNAAATLLDKAVPARRGSNIDRRVRYLIVDPTTGKDLLPMRDTLRQLVGRANQEDVVYLNDVANAQDMLQYINLAETTRMLICLISAADETAIAGAMLDTLMKWFSNYYRVDHQVSDRFSVICCKLFTTQDIMDENCREKAKQNAPIYQHALNAKNAAYSYPTFGVLHAYWNTYANDATAGLTQLSAQLHNLLILGRNALPLQNGSFKKYTGDDYPWFTFGIKETHALEIPLFEYIYAQLRNILDAHGDAKRLTSKVEYVRNEFLRRMRLENVDELDQKLDSWCGFIPVEISEEEFERVSDLRERTVENRGGRLGLFGKRHRDREQRKPQTETKMIGTSLNRDSEVLINQYYVSIIEENRPADICRMILQQAGAGIQSENAEDIKAEMDNLLELVFHAPEHCAVWQRLLRYYKTEITEDVIRQCVLNMTGVLQKVMRQIDAQLRIWREDNAVVGEALQGGDFPLYLTDNEFELYGQLVANMENWDLSKYQYPVWNPRILETEGNFAAVPSLNMLSDNVVHNMAEDTISDVQDTLPLGSPTPTKKLSIRIAKMRTLQDMIN